MNFKKVFNLAVSGQELFSHAASLNQFILSGDMAHSDSSLMIGYSNNLAALAEQGVGIQFVELYGVVQPYIEQFANGDLSRAELVEKIRPILNPAFPPEGFVDQIESAVNAEMEVYAFDPRMGYMDLPPEIRDQYQDIRENPSPYMQNYLQAVEENRITGNPDQAMAHLIERTAGENQASVMLGDAHFHGSHWWGGENDVDNTLGADNVVKIRVFGSREHAEESEEFFRMRREPGFYNPNNPEYTYCIAEDSAHFIYIASEDLAYITQAGLDAGMGGDLDFPVWDIEEPCPVQENGQQMKKGGLEQNQPDHGAASQRGSSEDGQIVTGVAESTYGESAGALEDGTPLYTNLEEPSIKCGIALQEEFATKCGVTIESMGVSANDANFKTGNLTPSTDLNPHETSGTTQIRLMPQP